MIPWRPGEVPKLSEEHRDALPTFLVLMGILVACGVLLILS